MRPLVFILIVLASVAAQAQVHGARLAYKDPTPITARQPHGRLFVGRELVGITSHATQVMPYLHSYDGAMHTRLNLPFPVHSAAFAGKYLYLADGLEGIVCLATDDWEVAARVKLQSPDRIGYITASGNGRHLIMCRHMFPDAIELWDRNPESGTLSQSAIFQPDEMALVYARRLAKQRPDVRIEIDPRAVRLEHLKGVVDVAFGDDEGKSIFACSRTAVFAFSRGDNDWKHVATANDGNRGIISLGLVAPYAIAASGSRVFVGGKDSLSWFNFNGLTLENHQWWVDERSGWEGRPQFPFLDSVRALAISKNAQFLFLGSAPGNRAPETQLERIHLLKIGETELTHVGSIPAGEEGSYLLQLEMSPDGKHLCAQTTDCQLMIFDLDERFWK